MQPIPLSKSELALVIYTKYHNMLSLEDIKEKLNNPKPTPNPNLFEIYIIADHYLRYTFFKYTIEWTDVYIESQLPF